MQDRPSISDFCVDSVEHSDELRIHGTPLHATHEELINQYKRKSCDEFTKQEAKYSCGNYLLGDFRGDICRIITAPGYAGGYLTRTQRGVCLATELGTLLTELPTNQVRFSSARLLKHITQPTRSVPCLPFRTVFENISRLPAGSVFEYTRNGPSRLRTYLPGNDAFGTFSEALEASVQPLQNKSVTVLFSGGVDSTALYSAIATVQPEESCQLAAVNSGPGTNSVERAEAVADRLGKELKVYDCGWPYTSKRVIETIEARFEQDFVDPLEPHFALSMVNDQQDVLISGHNMDALLTINMKRPQIPRWWDLKIRRNPRHTAVQLARNHQYTDRYIETRTLHRLYGAIVPRLFGDDFLSIPGLQGYLKGLLSTGYPNFTREQSTEVLDTEVSHLYDYAGQAAKREIVDLLNYLGYMQYWNKIYTSAGCASVVLPTNWAPLLSYAHNRRRTAIDALNPKREVYKYVRECQGRSYYQLAYDDYGSFAQNVIARREFTEAMEFPLLEQNRDRLKPDTSRVIELTEGTSVISTLQNEYQKAYERIGTPMSKDTIDHACRLLNLEFLLTNL